MGVFEMVVAIVALTTIGGIINRALKLREKTGPKNGELSTLREEMAQRQRELEERIKVLEAIVTSSEYELKRELHDLENS